MSKKTRTTSKRTVARQAKRPSTPVRSQRTTTVRSAGQPLGRDLRAGKRVRRMSARAKANLLKSSGSQLLALGLWDYAYLTAREPWIDNVARLAVLHASMRSNPNDFLLTASDANYHKPHARVYFRAPKANVPILVDFLVNALVPQVVRTQAGGKVQSTTLTAGFHHVSIVLLPKTAKLHSAGLTTQQGNPKQSLLEVEAVELTTLN